MDELLKKVKNTVLLSDAKWQVRDADDDILYFIHIEDAKKADCGTSCCLGCLFLPIGIIYAIVGGSDSKKKQLTAKIVNGKVVLDGDIKSTLKIYDLLKKSEIGDKIEETQNIVKMKKTKKITTILWIVLIILFLFILGQSGGNSNI